MAKRCAICGKTYKVGRQISHSHKVTRRIFYPNLQKVRLKIDGKPKRVWVCTRCLTSKKLLLERV
ncbi:50S ribosomal protein L28 [candidate division bacterium WOR-3 4484_18]|uniref:Large ribosomal subunit protein bL28 n=1 Tax=candidate division WOR-3 bacterium 4484_18 TaxID=2020626 RepID=A0A257LVS1_UNCW3|nr:MAG: 50S ribosomal protein L28 [candidate division bacterium WOR-3 4484_18]